MDGRLDGNENYDYDFAYQITNWDFDCEMPGLAYVPPCDVPECAFCGGE